MTGGGIIPAIAVLQVLEKKCEKVFWIGSESGMEDLLLCDHDLTFKAIPSAGLHGVGILKIPGNIIRLYRGWLSARKILKEFKPDVIFYTGGYIGIPVAYANGGRVPSVVFIPDIEPGTALKILLPAASIIALSNENSINYIKEKNKTRVCGYPVRRDLINWTRSDARTHFEITEKEKVILFFGGSKGARSINKALMTNLQSLVDDYFIIHISGKDNWKEIHDYHKNLDTKTRKRYRIFPFLDEDMGAAFASADLAVCRSGASTLGELPAFGLPAILVPYPHAWNYQMQNAQFLEKNGGAVIIQDQLLEKELPNAIRQIFSHSGFLEDMKSKMKLLFEPEAAEKIADCIIKAKSYASLEGQSNG